MDDSVLIKLWYNDFNVMIKNSLIHKDSIDIIKNLDKGSTLYLENVSIKGLKSIKGNLKMTNVVVYDGFSYEEVGTYVNVNTSEVKSKNITDKIFFWNSALK